MSYANTRETKKSPAAGAVEAPAGGSRVQMKQSLRGMSYQDGQSAVQMSTQGAEPDLRGKHAGKGITNKSHGSELFVNGVSSSDVIQGSIADCYLVAALASLADQNAGAITSMVKKVGKNFQVRFYKKESGFFGTSYKAQWVTVSGDLPTWTGGGLVYSRSDETNKAGARELWPSVIEKGYAAFKGGYSKIGEGGSGETALEAITGKDASTVATSKDTDDLFKQVQRALSGSKAVTAGTHGKSKDKMYKGKGVYSWHDYTLMSVREADKKRYVTLRNPWGQRYRSADIPAGDKTKNSATFELEWSEFRRLYKDVKIGG